MSLRHKMAPYAAGWGARRYEMAACHSRHFLSGIHGFNREKTDTEREWGYNKVSRRHEMAPYAITGSRALCSF